MNIIKSVYYLIKSTIVTWQVLPEVKISGWPRISRNARIGREVTINSSRGRTTKIVGTGTIRIGDRSLVNVGSCIFSEVSVTIGDDVAIADECYIIDTNSHGIAGQEVYSAAVQICDGAWICARSMILPGVRVGRMSVVAAGSVVTKDVPDFTLVGGNPARVIKTLNYPPSAFRAWHNA